MRKAKHFLLMAAMLLCSVTSMLGDTLPVTLTESDGLLATKSTDSSGREQYEYTSPVYTLEEGTNTLYFTFIKGYAPNGAELLDNTGFPFVALVEFDLYDGEGNEIPLTSSNFSTNAQETSEGAISNICDDDRTTFWHSRWSGDGVGDYHRLMVTLPEGCALSEFQFRYVTRDTRQCVPGCIQVGVTPEVAPYEVSGTCGDNLIWTLNSEGNLVIEGIGSMPDFDSYADVPWSGYGALSNIILLEGVTGFGYRAFRGCSSLTSITLPKSLTSIGDGAFKGCRSLTSIVVAEGNKVYDSRGGCNAIIETSSNTLIQGCSTTIIPEGVTSIGDYAFQGCSSLASITIPEGVTSIGSNAFYVCSSLTSITISENSQLTSIGYRAFKGCSSLTSITLPESVTSIGSYAFSACSSLTSIVVEEGNDVYDSRNECNAIIETTTNTLIQGCSTTIIPESVTSIGYGAFDGCSSLTSITIPEGVTSIGDDAFYGCRSLTSITIPEGVTSIGSYAFIGCSSLTSITLPKSLTSIEGDAFHGCSGELTVNCNIPSGGVFCSSEFTKVTIGEGVTSIGDKAFWGCSSLTSITLPENSQLTSIGSSAFRGCSGLTSITLPESVTSIGEGAFYGCSGELTVNCNIPSASSYSNGAFYSGEFTKVTIGEGVTSIGDYAFYNCSSLTSITLPENSQLTSIGAEAFRSCRSLTSITIPKSLKSIGGSAFDGCTSLTTITIPESVTSIGYRAFYDCSSLTSITIPEGVTYIGSYAFSNCPELTDVYCHAEKVPSTNTKILDGSNIEYATLHVPTCAVNEYKNTAPWSGFGTIVSLDAALTRITLSASSVTLTEGETLTLTLTTTPEDADRNLISWSSSAPNVATVDNAGKVTAIAPGTAIITATANDGSGVSASCEVTVMRKEIPVTGIELNPTSAALTEGEELPITATIAPDDATNKSVSWSSSNPSIATVDNAGKVTAKSAGTATITATANDGSGVSASCEVTVTPASYIITFLVDGGVYATETLSRGATISVPDAPTKEGHTFSGWSGLPETMPAKDITVSATFTVNKYQVTFKIDGVVIATYTQDYGSTIVAPDAPEREGYTFSGWGNVAETVPASDVTYEGSYSVNSYTVTYLVDGEVVHSESANYGAAIVAPEEPTKEGHTFSGWSGLPETMPAKDITVSATFTVNKYLVTFTVDGVAIVSDSLEYGAPIVPPTMPEREGYTFSGWGDVAETVPASDVTYEGSYTANLYNVYYFVGATLVHSVKVAYGEPIPEYIYEPAEEGYTFLGWIGETYATMPAHDVTYTANIDNGIGTLTIDYSQLNIYDLTGRKVTDTENLKGGIYIINGKKVVIND